MGRKWIIPCSILALTIVAVVAVPWLTADVPLPVGRGFNVLLISLDTTRADYLGCYGHLTVKTPNIDRLAAEGTLFEQCTSAVPVTLPSHASIMAGTYPFVHGVRDNGSFRLHEDNKTLAEALSRAKYATAAVIGAHVLDREYGIAQGFDLYDDMHAAKVPIDPKTGEASNERRADEVTDVAINWLQANASKQFFLFVHYFDPHHPYEPPEPYATDYSDPYAGEIAYTDEQVGRLLEALTESGADTRTLVVVFGDHGEGLMDHGEDTHGCFVYDTTVSVPLIMYGPGVIPPTRRVSAQVRAIDIMPTILAFLGFQPSPPVQGVSLLPLVAGRVDDMELAAYSESLYPRYNFGYSHLLALRAGGWKYIHAPRPELYHVSTDPGELQNLAEAKPLEVARMRRQLSAVLEESPAAVGAEDVQVELSSRAVEALRSLGYVGAPMKDESFVAKDRMHLLQPSGPDPKDHTEEIRLTVRSMHLIEERDAAGAEIVLRELLERFPEHVASFSWAYSQLGLVLTAQKKNYEEAIALYRKALEIAPNDGQTLTNLGVALAMTGQTEQAIQAYTRALAFPPLSPNTHYGLALALRSQGRLKEAQRHFQRAAQLGSTRTGRAEPGSHQSEH